MYKHCSLAAPRSATYIQLFIPSVNIMISSWAPVTELILLSCGAKMGALCLRFTTYGGSVAIATLNPI